MDTGFVANRDINGSQEFVINRFNGINGSGAIDTVGLPYESALV